MMSVTHQQTMKLHSLQPRADSLVRGLSTSKFAFADRITFLPVSRAKTFKHFRETSYKLVLGSQTKSRSKVVEMNLHDIFELAMKYVDSPLPCLGPSSTPYFHACASYLKDLTD